MHVEPHRRHIVAFFFWLGLISLFTYIEWPTITSLLFNQLPLGLGVSFTSGTIFLLIIGALIGAVSYFGVMSPNPVSIEPVSDEDNKYTYVRETFIKALFGMSFGGLTGVLCSLLYVLIESELPYAFLQYDVLFRNLNWEAIVYFGLISGVLYLWGGLKVAVVMSERLFCFKLKDSSMWLTLSIILSTALVASIFVTTLLVLSTGSSALTLVSFCALISFILFAVLGLLYWLIGIESSIISSVIFWFLVTYLAELFI